MQEPADAMSQPATLPTQIGSAHALPHVPCANNQASDQDPTTVTTGCWKAEKPSRLPAVLTIILFK